MGRPVWLGGAHANSRGGLHAQGHLLVALQDVDNAAVDCNVGYGDALVREDPVPLEQALRRCCRLIAHPCRLGS